MKKNFLILLMLFAVVSCHKKDGSKNENVFYVQTQKVIRKDLKEELVISGNIKGKDEAVIYPRINGKLVKNLVREGDFVKKDDAIALVKKDDVGVVYEPAPVPSTISGYVGRVYQDEGADVNPMTPIALVVNQDVIRVQIEVPEKYLSRISVGSKVYIKVDAYADKIFYTKVDKVSPVVDKLSRTFLVEAFIENRENLLKSGMIAEAHVILQEVQRALAIPVSAIVEKEGKKYVYLADRLNNVAIEKEIKHGIKNTDWIEVKNLKEGDEIITIGLYGISNNSPIKVLNQENL
ncbi:MAG: efflux RND transporter periplasmic adaptor subunit [Elusimicrobiota bacterium]